MVDEVRNMREQIFRIIFASFMPCAINIFEVIFSCNFYLVKFITDLPFIIFYLCNMVPRETGFVLSVKKGSISVSCL